MKIKWNLNQELLDSGRESSLKIIHFLQPHWEIERFEVWIPCEKLNARETSNPKPPQSFWRGDCSSFKDLQELCVGKVKIAPRAREREGEGGKRRRRRWKNEWKNGSNWPRGKYTQYLPTGVSGQKSGVSSRSGVSGSPWNWVERAWRILIRFDSEDKD
jgi:hypothetical protein